MLEKLEKVSIRYMKLTRISKEWRQSWNLLESRSFDVYKKATALIIVMLGCLKINIKCYNLKLSDKLKEESCIRFIYKNSIEFLILSIYLIYNRLVVYTTQNLTYFKGYILFIRLI